MVCRMDVDFAERTLRPPQCFFCGTGDSGRPVEETENRCTLCPSIFHHTTQSVVGRNPPLPIGGPSQGNLGRIAQDDILHCDRIADGKNVGVTGLQVFIDLDATTCADRQSGANGQCIFWTNTDTKDHQLRGQSLARAQTDDQPCGRLLDRFGRLSQQ